MPYPATAFRVMIASPSDVQQERDIAQEVIAEWNAIHSEEKSIVLLPLIWERDATPVQGDRPQAIINKQLLKKADILVAIFWARIGSPTGKAQSGTIEELQEHVSANKPAILYFSSAPLPHDADTKQLDALREFKKEAQARGLYHEFKSSEDFRRDFTRHLDKTVVDEPIFAGARTSSLENLNAEPAPEIQLSENARRLLKEATGDDGRITKMRIRSGLLIQTNGQNFVHDASARTQAEWEGALDELRGLGYIKDLGHKGEVFTLTREGYQAADKITKDW